MKDQLKYILPILLLLPVKSIGQGVSYEFEYLDNPNIADTLCINEINQAKKDIQKGNLKFIMPIRDETRYEQELEQLCEKFGLKFEYGYLGCMVYEGHTDACYEAFMDKVLAERFGSKFKEKLNKTADSLYYVNVRNDTIKYFYCDLEPKHDKIYPGLGIATNVSLNVKSKRKEWVSDGKDFYAIYDPFMDIEFTIDKSGTISNFNLIDFVPQLYENLEYKNDLFEKAIDEIESNYFTWTPGSINGKKVNTYYTLRVRFKKDAN